MHKSFSSKKLTSSAKNSARNSVEGHIHHAFNKAVPKVGECPSKQPKQVNLAAQVGVGGRATWLSGRAARRGV